MSRGYSDNEFVKVLRLFTLLLLNCKTKIKNIKKDVATSCVFIF